MIHEVDEAIRLLLADGGVPGGGGELAFDAPTRDWTAKRNAPTVNVFLYDIHEDLARRRTGTTEEHDEAGMIVGWRAQPRWYKLSYLVTAWTNRPTDEHRLLSEVLACLTRTQALTAPWLTGTLAELGLAVVMQTAGPVSEGGAATDVWSALGGELKPAIDLKVTAPLAGPRAPAGPPVTEGVVLRAGTDTAERHLRYEDTTAQGEGFATVRPKPLPPARRRRTAAGP
jgi:Pvc16 N-terminal domain